MVTYFKPHVYMLINIAVIYPLYITLLSRSYFFHQAHKGLVSPDLLSQGGGACALTYRVVALGLDKGLR